MMYNALEVAVAETYSFLKARDGNQIVSKLYDGTYHMQTVGIAGNIAEVKIYCDTLVKRYAINDMAVIGELIHVVHDGTDYYGYIRDAVAWEDFKMGAEYTGTFTMLIAQ